MISSRWPSAKSVSNKKAFMTPPFWCCITHNCNLHLWVLQHKMAIRQKCIWDLSWECRKQVGRTWQDLANWSTRPWQVPHEILEKMLDPELEHPYTSLPTRWPRWQCHIDQAVGSHAFTFYYFEHFSIFAKGWTTWRCHVFQASAKKRNMFLLSSPGSWVPNSAAPSQVQRSEGQYRDLKHKHSQDGRSLNLSDWSSELTTTVEDRSWRTGGRIPLLRGLKPNMTNDSTSSKTKQRQSLTIEARAQINHHKVPEYATTACFARLILWLTND